MYHTQNSGVGLWRMIQPAKWINRSGLAEVKTLPFYFRTHRTPSWENYLADCKKKGIEPSTEQFQKNAKKYPREVPIEEVEKLCNWADVIVVMRQDSRHHCALLQAMGDLKKPVILETDDFVHYVPPYNPGAKFYQPGSEQADIWSTKQFQLVNYVQVTTPGLRELYRQLNPNIEIIPNCIDPDYWLSKKEPEQHPGEIRLGWTGANAHWGDLRRLKDVIHPVLKKYPQVKFHFIGQLPDWWDDLKKEGRLVHHKFRNLATYPEYLHSFNYDIGVAPLVDNLFNRGKSNIRWIEYSSNKVATVCSPIWAYSRDAYGVMKEGKNVMFAKETDEWIAKLSKLIEDETLRKKMSQQAYDDVLKYYNLETRAKDFVNYYQRVYDDFHKK